MKEKESFNFEILIVDENGSAEISTAKSMAMGLCYSDKLWKKSDIKTTSKSATIQDKSLGITVTVNEISPSDSEEVAFTLLVSGSAIEKVEAFREDLFAHINHKLGFETIRIISDEISANLSLAIYPLIKESENALRKYLAKYFVLSDGISWWEHIAPASLVSTVKKRSEEIALFGSGVETDITLTNFDELTDLVEKSDLSATFINSWKQLGEIKLKVEHNSIFDLEDFNSANNLSKLICNELLKSESLLGKQKSSVTKTKVSAAKKEKPAPVKAQTKAKPAPKAEVKPAVPKEEIEVEAPKVEAPKVEEKKPAPAPVKEAPKVVEEKKEEPVPTPAPAPVAEKKEESKKTSGDFQFITEDELVAELKQAETGAKFVDLKMFVTETLADKGYAFGPAYSLAKTLDAKGVVKIYDTTNESGFTVKAISTN